MKGLEQIKADELALTRRKPKARRRQKAKVGRPRSEFSERYQVRCSIEQFKEWMAAANREDRTLQNWIRRTLDVAAKPTYY
jgi:predicted HicB family RNase H-like nuclease